MRSRILRIAGPVFGIGLFAFAVFVLSRELSKYGWSAIWQSVLSISPARIALAMCFAAGCYGALTCYDFLAVRYLRNKLPYRRIALASFVAYAFSHNVGLSLVTGTPMKYRIYSTWGLRAIDVVKIAAFCGLTFWTGFATLMGAALLIDPAAIPQAVHASAGGARLVGVVLLGVVTGYLALSVKHRPIRIRGREWIIPQARFAVGQVLAGCAEWIMASATLYTVLGPAAGISYPAFLAIFLFAYVSGFVSQVPGGLGVFETVILYSLKDALPPPAIMGALLAYRAVYYLLPLVAALILFGIHEWRRGRTCNA